MYLSMDLSFDEAEIINKALQHPEARLGSQSELITQYRQLIQRLRAAGYLQQNANDYRLNAKGYSEFKHLSPPPPR
jgi:hypothetical protein